MDEDEIVIVDEPPKPPTQCELRHAESACLTHSAFLLMMRTSIICANYTRNISQIIEQSFSVAKRQQVITNYFS